ncbi:hypothetical protein LOC54_01665 [Acetobacter sp. AN02]|uniref:hypothetical protein n=1 Tax=Acetobacter sp. AN02 TaxID=2894186 RepID=UPI00243457E5|nr:hypothetical protein [Acetobacter sp. AN02]MDG6093830.1 hypothetical protein [Acetobacter sp. AN02]
MSHIHTIDDLIREHGEAAPHVAASQAEWAIMRRDEARTRKWLDLFSEATSRTRNLKSASI